MMDAPQKKITANVHTIKILNNLCQEPHFLFSNKIIIQDFKNSGNQEIQKKKQEWNIIDVDIQGNMHNGGKLKQICGISQG